MLIVIPSAHFLPNSMLAAAFLGQRIKKIKMITELLEATLTELLDSRFDITEFQLGKEPYEMLKKECAIISNFQIDIQNVNSYRGIPVKLHSSDNAVMYSLSLKTK